jgi:hypothetical protein
MMTAIKKLFAYLATIAKPRSKQSSVARDIELQVARLTLQPGDAIVISTEGHLTRDQVDQIRAMVRRPLWADVKVLVLSGGLAMTVLRQGYSATPDSITPVCLAVDHRAPPIAPPPPPTRSVRCP